MELQFDYWPISRLKPDARNAKLHPTAQIEAICKSIREIGFADPIGVEPDGLIVEGHGRYAAARALGMDAVPVIVLNGLSEEQRRAYALIHNKLTMDTGFDMDKLRMELEAIKSIDMSAFDFSFDFDFAAVEEGGGSFTALDESTDYEAVAEAIEEPKVKRGQIWQLGRHRLMCGDSTASEQVSELMAGEEADLLLTDPPYGVAYVGKTDEALSIEGDDFDDEDFRAFMNKALAAAFRSVKPGASFYIWHAATRCTPVDFALMDLMVPIREQLIWIKNSFVLSRQDYHWQHEPCFYGWRPGAAHRWFGDRSQSTVLQFEKPTRSAEHPTMKPVALFEYLIGNSSAKGDLVLDVFAGSGTTVVACERMGRAARVMEIDPRYCDVIIRRWEAMTGKEAVQVK